VFDGEGVSPLGYDGRVMPMVWIRVCRRDDRLTNPLAPKVPADDFHTPTLRSQWVLRLTKWTRHDGPVKARYMSTL
jgi:hypothetical protein